ncbi:Insulin receptor precursor, putative [Pediculus humanus corporis]|uniref:Insulin-like receptor n=1 Tax=Pediculus humanus subsp. corporis TaxID=121224 RepID=E0VXW7_PEDHC|nr:Insulin receptor precursor, putative [Pediculus humanus corporis]EEB18223.1 Insulin receptor precursor, putative [Pediculus humanus corporis]
MTNRACKSCNELINNITFPELREVTGYVIFWRVQGLRSFGTLFPNLSVIRGKTLFHNYALVIYESKALQEIGLYSLTHILRGSVRFDENSNLCFVDTIDWDWIAPQGAKEHFIGDNRPIEECLKCPISVNNEKCPLSSSGEPLCWNKEHCQKDFRDCVKDENGECCHESCLGGCSGKLSKDCYVCKNVVFKNDCTQECPENMYKYLDRRCVTESECFNMTKPLDVEKRDIASPFPFRPILDMCTLECPANFSEYEKETEYGLRFQCRPCDGPCKKECPGGSINSISSAQKFAGCTHIKGSLEIHLRFAGNIVTELQESLRSVEEISGYLKVARSLPLLSLDFLKNLKVIRGEELHNNKSAFVLLDNERLEELWDWDAREKDLRILNGRLAIHFNPKLCFYKIEKFVEIVKIKGFTEDEVPRGTNGDKEACELSVVGCCRLFSFPNKVVIRFEKFQHYDQRTLLGYVLYFKKAPNKNVTLYYGRNACGGDGWMDKDVPAPKQDNHQNEISYDLIGLKPFTQYAYFIKTYAISSERSGARSGIQYFITNPGTPTSPRSLFAFSNSTSEVVISWEPPAEMNGNFTHYFVEAEAMEDHPKSRDFCSEPLVIATKKLEIPTSPPPAVKTSSDSCACEAPRKVDLKVSEAVRDSEIYFENALQNSFIVRSCYHHYHYFLSFFRTDNKRTKREMNYAEGSHPQILQKNHFFNEGVGGKSFGNTKKEKVSFTFEVRTNKLVVRNLNYFTNYKIQVQACRAVVEGENGVHSPCKTADKIPVITLIPLTSNGTVEETNLRWEEPPNPNGLILSYQIEYRRVDNDKYKSVVECIVREKFLEQKKEYVLKHLPPGNYSVRVLASSLAGDGPYSSPLTFYIRQPPHPSTIDILGIGLGAICGIAFIFILYMFWKRKTSGVPKLFANVNPEYVSAATIYVPDEWEVPRENIELIRELGQGSFGMVYEGIARDIVQGEPEVRCAVKTVNEVSTDRDRMEFLNEASVMKAFNTHHVVQLLGVVSEGQPTLVVMELMVNGDLKTYLRSHRPEFCEDKKKQPPTLRRIIRMAMEIADGMAYLAAKKFVHRDLAARNCMVAEDLTVKIGDFGMTRDIYETDYYKKGTKGLLPVRWMAPESLKDGVFTTHSDVWSYGIVLWEMVTLASQPYQGLSNDQVLRYVIEGGVMERPENCPNKLYDLMKLCWQHKPSSRPHFMSFVTKLLPDASPEFCEKSYYHSREGQELRWFIIFSLSLSLSFSFVLYRLIFFCFWNVQSAFRSSGKFENESISNDGGDDSDDDDRDSITIS